MQLRYRVTYAKVLDANRKFLEAALRYYELSQAQRREIPQVGWSLARSSVLSHSTPLTTPLSLIVVLCVCLVHHVDHDDSVN